MSAESRARGEAAERDRRCACEGDVLVVRAELFAAILDVALDGLHAGVAEREEDVNQVGGLERRAGRELRLAERSHVVSEAIVRHIVVSFQDSWHGRRQLYHISFIRESRPRSEVRDESK